MLYWIFNIDGVNASAVYSSATRDICCAALKPIEKKGKEQPGNTILLSASIVEPLCEFFKNHIMPEDINSDICLVLHQNFIRLARKFFIALALYTFIK